MDKKDTIIIKAEELPKAMNVAVAGYIASDIADRLLKEAGGNPLDFADFDVDEIKKLVKPLVVEKVASEISKKVAADLSGKFAFSMKKKKSNIEELLDSLEKHKRRNRVKKGRR